MAEYLIVIERAEHNFAAYSPDVPGCIATGATLEEVEANMREALRSHIEVMKAEGLPVPEPSTSAKRVSV
ncbi:MAG: type II toxin-antitoxin system HicB family antitoxin [Armatimonadota bacterium]